MTCVLMAEDDVYSDGVLKCIVYNKLSINWRFIMSFRKDKTGMVFGKLTVLNYVGMNTAHKSLWECKCECGNITTVISGQLASGQTKSCGCIIPNFKHGGWKKSSYNTWRAMIRRCNNPKDKDYCRYGAVGITVCPEWLDYLTFEKDMGEPVGDETLDRINPYGNYIKDNCRWATVKVQNQNTRVRESRKFTGVILINNKWIAKITHMKKSYYSKVFNTIEEATQARKDLELKYWGRK